MQFNIRTLIAFTTSAAILCWMSVESGFPDWEVASDVYEIREFKDVEAYSMTPGLRKNWPAGVTYLLTCLVWLFTYWFPPILMASAAIGAFCAKRSWSTMIVGFAMSFMLVTWLDVRLGFPNYDIISLESTEQFFEVSADEFRSMTWGDFITHVVASIFWVVMTFVTAVFHYLGKYILGLAILIGVWYWANGDKND